MPTLSETQILPQFSFASPSTSHHDFRGRNDAMIFGCIPRQSNFYSTCLKQKMLPPELRDQVTQVAPEWTGFDPWEATLEERPRDEWPESASGTVIDETGSGSHGTSTASDDSDELLSVSPLRICPPVNYLRLPVNYFSRPLPNDVRNLIISGLRTSISSRILMKQLTTSMEILGPSSFVALYPRYVEASYYQCLEWRDLLWVKLILVEESGIHLSDKEPLYTSCKIKMKSLTCLTSRLSSWLEDMRNAGLKNLHHKMELEDLERKRHHYYEQNHPVRLISPYLRRDKILVYLPLFLGFYTDCTMTTPSLKRIELL